MDKELDEEVVWEEDLVGRVMVATGPSSSDGLIFLIAFPSMLSADATGLLPVPPCTVYTTY